MTIQSVVAGSGTKHQYIVGGELQQWAGGSRSWRNNNPGNIEYGNFAKSHGAIASDGRFAIFPDYATGRKAKETLIFESSGYKDKTLSGAISKYAPAFENNTGAYYRAVANAAGSNKTMSAYTPEERQKILDAMEKVEGYKAGTVNGKPVTRTTGVLAGANWSDGLKQQVNSIMSAMGKTGESIFGVRSDYVAPDDHIAPEQKEAGWFETGMVLVSSLGLLIAGVMLKK